MKRVALLAAVLSSSVLFADQASAQYQLQQNEWPQDRELDDRSTWLLDRRYREGVGFRVGDFELHPGIGADIGYDSNFLRRADDPAVELPPVQTLRLRVSPHFSVSTLGSRRRDDGAQPSVNFRAELGATYFEFIPVGGGNPEDEAGDQSRLQDQRNLAADLKLGLDILPGRTWSGRIYAGASRTTRPTNEADVNVNFNRILPQAGAELIWAPGSGLLDWQLGYNFSGNFFESGEINSISSFRNEISTRGRWRFLPRTALMFDARLGFVTFPNGSAGLVNKSDSHPLRARIGVNGLVTQSFAVLAMLGWGASFYGTGNQDFDSIIAQAELKWFFTPTDEPDPAKTSSMNNLAVGFLRDFDDSYIGTYLERDMGYARFTYLFGGAFLLVAEASAGAVVFPEQSNPTFNNPDGWTDVRADAKLFGEYRFIDSFGVNVDLGYTGYFSDTVLSDPAGVQNALSFQDFRAFLGARWFM